MEGNFLMKYSYGNYGFIQHEKMKQLPLILYDMGIEHRCQEAYHFHNDMRPGYKGYLIQYTLQGHGIYGNGNSKQLLKNGFGFFSKIPEQSQYHLPDDSFPIEYRKDGWDFFYLHFDGSAAEVFYETFCELTGPVFFLNENEQPIRLFLSFFDSYKRKGSLELYESSEFLYRFLSQLLRSIESPSTNRTGVIYYAQKYIREYFQSINNIQEIANFCGVSHEHLTRCFKKETGQTPLQFLIKIKIEHALFLLLNSSDSIEAIAIACGFQNGNYFAKVFRKYLSCSPEEYRKSYHA